MSEPFNPFAAPQSMDDVQPEAVGNYESLAGVERGLRLIYFGLCGVFLSAIAAGVFAIADRSLMIIGAAGVLISWLMLIIGPFFCLSVPDESGAKVLIGTSILFQLSGFMILVASGIGLGDLPFGRLISQFCGTIGVLLFVCFQMKIARFIRREDLRKKAIDVLIGSILLIVVAGLTTVSLIHSGTQGPGFIGIIFTGLGALIVFVMYANLINYLAKAIGSLRFGSSASALETRYLG